MAPTVESFEAVAAYALARGISVIVENVHGFGTDHPEEIVELIKAARPATDRGAAGLRQLSQSGHAREADLKMLFPLCPNRLPRPRASSSTRTETRRDV